MANSMKKKHKEEVNESAFRIVVSKADEFFKLHGIKNGKEWNKFAIKRYNLKEGDLVYYEGNMCGFEREYYRRLDKKECK